MRFNKALMYTKSLLLLRCKQESLIVAPIVEDNTFTLAMMILVNATEITYESYYMPMPKNASKLYNCELGIILKWMSESIQNS